MQSSMTLHRKLRKAIHLLISLGLLLLLDGNDLIVAHSGENSHREGLVGGLAILEGLSDLASEVVRILRELNILAGVAILVHQGHESIASDIQQRVLLADDERHLGVVGGGDDILILLSSEDIDGSEVALGVAVLASLGGGNSRHLARVLLDADVTKAQEQHQAH